METGIVGPEAKKFASQTLERLFELGLTPHPRNYAVWYSYFSGNPAIREAVDAVLVGGVAFADSHGLEIYRDYFSSDDDNAAIRETGQRVEAALGQVVSILSAAGDDSSEFAESLDGISGELANGDSIEHVQAIVNRLSEHTEAMAEKNRQFEKKIKESNSEITQLRQNLEDTRLEAMTDSLTGLYNRKFFDTAFSQAARTAAETATPLSVLMLDIDHFKKFNDTYGHSLGDVVLKQVSNCLGACVKGRDITARYGGEEFVILLPDTGVGDAATVAEQIRRTVASKKIVMRSTGKSLGKITLSIGAAQFKPPEDVGILLSRADEAMYHAKKSGRNQVATEEVVDTRVAAAS